MNPQDLVVALYRNLLGRDPDEAGRADKVERLSRGLLTPDALIREFTESIEYINETLGGERLFRDQSQFGELEILVKRLCERSGIDKVVVDVGARGKARSNSYDLLRTFGWRGVLVEANPRLIAEIGREFAGLDIEIVECAVSDFEGSAVFHIGINDDVSSLSLENATAWGAVADKVTVSVRRLASILQEMSVPKQFGLLSIDLEGEDVKVLNDLIGESPYRPAWIIIEASHDFTICSLSDIPLRPEVMESYTLVGQTRANLILERRS